MKASDLTEPGYYWARCDSGWGIVHAMRWPDDDLNFTVHGGEMMFDAKEISAYWRDFHGPMVTPTDLWLPIDSAPKDGSVILLGFVPVGNMQAHDRRVYEGRWHDDQQTFTSVNGFILLTAASHWMPLPLAP